MELFMSSKARSLLIVIAVGTVVLRSVGSAAAGTNPYTRNDHLCPASSVCLYKDVPFTGGGGIVVFPQDTAGCDVNKVTYPNYKNAPSFPDGTPLNDQVSSIFNNTPFAFQFWIDKNFSNPSEDDPVFGDPGYRIGPLTIGPGGWVSDLTTEQYLVCGNQFCNDAGGCYCTYQYWESWNDRISSHN
jgi:hypothetical protein